MIAVRIAEPISVLKQFRPEGGVRCFWKPPSDIASGARF
jgi:hypothetical protein